MSSSQCPFMKEHDSAGGLSLFRRLPGIVVAAAAFTVGQRDSVTQLPSSCITSFFLSTRTNKDDMWEGRGVCEFDCGVDYNMDYSVLQILSVKID